MSAAHGGALARPRPIVPVPSISTATTVPQALKRPLLNWVAPTNTGANAGNRYGVPADGEPALNDDARQIPARPAMVADTRSEQNRRRSTRMLASRAASGLNPVAYSRRPVAEYSMNNHSAMAMTNA